MKLKDHINVKIVLSVVAALLAYDILKVVLALFYILLKPLFEK